MPHLLITINGQLKAIPKENVLAEITPFKGITTADIKTIVDTKEDFTKLKKDRLFHVKTSGYETWEVVPKEDKV
jgi:hypothetical protein